MDVFPHKKAYDNYKKITDYPSAYSSSGKFPCVIFHNREDLAKDVQNSILRGLV